MSRPRGAVIVLIAFLIAVPGIRLRQYIEIDQHTIIDVIPAAGDDLGELVATGISLGPSLAFAGCSSFDVKDVCCPAGCAAKNGPTWAKADDIFRGCMRGLGCSETDVKNATVFMKCDCEKK